VFPLLLGGLGRGKLFMINRPHPLAEYIPHPRGRRSKKALKNRGQCLGFLLN